MISSAGSNSDGHRKSETFVINIISPMHCNYTLSEHLRHFNAGHLLFKLIAPSYIYTQKWLWRFESVYLLPD